MYVLNVTVIVICNHLTVKALTLHLLQTDFDKYILHTIDCFVLCQCLIVKALLLLAESFICTVFVHSFFVENNIVESVKI